MHKQGRNYWLIILVLMLFLLVICIFYVNFQNKQKDLVLAMFDVGQGDAIFVKSPTGVQMLIDTGPPKEVLNLLPKMMPFLDRSIDIVVITNPDLDHIGGFLDILQNYKVGKIIHPGTNSDSDTFLKLEEIINQKKIESILAKSGMRVDLGGGAVLDVLFPNQDVSLWSNNDGSLVSKLSYGETTIILTGDATKATEDIILKNLDRDSLDVDILKVGHHGSRTSSSVSFVETLSPKYALISLGQENRYGHPHIETLITLATFGVNVLRTDLLGTIIMKSDGINETFSFIK